MKLFGRAEETAQRIVDAFKNPEDLPKALAPIFIHRNDENVPCRRWSWYNQMLTVLSGTSDARGIRQWNTVGRKLKKGSKAIWILGPCLKTIREKDDNGEEVKRNVLYGFKGIPVFAVEDTEGKPLPGNEKYDEWMQKLPLLEVAQSWGIHVGTYSGEDKNALGYFQFGTGRKAIMMGVENLSTWAHELVHAADHPLRANLGQFPFLPVVGLQEFGRHGVVGEDWNITVIITALADPNDIWDVKEEELQKMKKEWTAIGNEHGFRLVSVDGVDVEYIDDDTATQN